MRRKGVAPSREGRKKGREGEREVLIIICENRRGMISYSLCSVSMYLSMYVCMYVCICTYNI